MTWDPDHYLRFAAHRARPAEDLIARIVRIAGAGRDGSPKDIVDLGCGPGNVTALLQARWPRARLTGIDNSEAMLAEARKLGLDATFADADIADWTPDNPPDLIFSNAVLHWLPDHADLFVRLMTYLAPGGLLAVQMPRNFADVTHLILQRVAREGPWAAQLEDLNNHTPVATPETYADWLAGLSDLRDIWETQYFHELQGPDAVFQWLSATAIRPYTARLDGVDRDGFLEACRRQLAEAYPARADGVTVLPFRRLFIVARKTIVPDDTAIFA